MDTGEGRFRMMEEMEARLAGLKNPLSVFSEGEEVHVKNSLFKIRKITHKGLILDLLPRAVDD